MFQDLSTGKVKGIGKETGGLYILLDNNKHHDTNKGPKLMAANVQSVGEDMLWHKRLGHLSMNVLNKMSLTMKGHDNITRDICTIFL